MENIYISKLARYYIEEDAGWKGKTPHFSASRPRYLPSYIHWPPERLDWFALYATSCLRLHSQSTTLFALYLISRLKESCPDNRTRDGRFLPRGHMLFLGAYHIAARQLEDDHYGKDTWNAASAGSVTAKYLQAFERRVSRHFRYQVNFSKEAVIDFVFALWLKYGNTGLYFALQSWKLLLMIHVKCSPYRDSPSGGRSGATATKQGGAASIAERSEGIVRASPGSPMPACGGTCRTTVLGGQRRTSSACGARSVSSTVCRSIDI